MIFGTESIEQKLGVKIIRDSDRENNIRLWRSMLEGKCDWNSEKTPSKGYPAIACREVARNVTFESESVITGNDTFAELFNRNIFSMKDEISETVCGYGRVLVLPFTRMKSIYANILTPDEYFPMRYNDIGNLTEVVAVSTTRTADDFYTMFEIHSWDEMTNGYSIRYRAFHSRQKSDYGQEVSVSSVEEWAHLQDLEGILEYPHPIFEEVIRHYGKALFANAVTSTKRADMQGTYIDREYKHGRIRTFASIDLFRKSENKRNKNGFDLKLPDDEDAFVILDADDKQFTIDNFAPSLRDDNYWRGANEHARSFELDCGLAYGTISDPQERDKTAEEERNGKARMWKTIRGEQEVLEPSFKRLAESCFYLCKQYGIIPPTPFEFNIDWGDSIMEDPDKEFQRLKELVAMGALPPEYLVAWYKHTSIEEAKKLIPSQSTDSME